jgi:two-component system CheB/CheR fusion protein
LQIEVPDLEELLLRTVRTLSSVERQVTDREGHWHTMIVRPYRTVDGRVEGAILGLLPATQLEQISDRLDERSEKLGEKNAEFRGSRDRFDAPVSVSLDTIYVMSPDWSVMRQLNSRGILSDTKEPNENWLEEYIDREDQAQVLAAIKEAIKTKSVFELEHRVRRRDGSLGWIYSRAVPVMDENGEIVEWIGSAGGITERKATREASSQGGHKEDSGS